MKIRTRLILYVNIALWFTGAVIIFAAHFIHKGALEAEIETTRTAQMRKWQVVCQEALAGGEPRFMLNYAQLLEFQPGVAYSRFYLPNGEMARAFSRWGPDPGAGERTDVLRTVLPVTVNDREAGSAVIGFSESYRRRSVAQGMLVAWAKILLVIALLAVLNLITAGFFADRLSERFAKLRDAALEIEKGNFDVRLSAGGMDELHFFAGHFNRMAQRLSELDKLKDEFISTASHDLRNPLSAIQMSTDLLLDESIHGKLNEPQRVVVKRIFDIVSRLGVYVTTILDAAKIKAGRAQYAPQPVDALPILRDVAGLYAAQAQGTKIELRADLPESVPKLLADPVYLEQAVANLVNNALKFTSQGGHVVVGIKQEGEEVEIRVEDTGAGISEENQRKLFGAFRQFGVPEQRAKRIVGTGLGLYTVKQSVEGMGGSISLRSKLGEGTTFFLRFPVASAPRLRGLSAA